jgi:hypothetical protein
VLLKNKKIIALLLTIVVLISILNNEYTLFKDNLNKDQNVNNYDDCYFYEEMLYANEEKTRSENNNLNIYRSNSKIISNYFNKYIVGNICSFNNILKLKYTAEIKNATNIYFDSVFVVTYIHKKDGKI